MKKNVIISAVVLCVIAAIVYIFTNQSNSEEVDSTAPNVQEAVDYFANCSEATLEDYLEALNASRTSEETVTSLPLGLKFGLNREEVQAQMNEVLKMLGKENGLDNNEATEDKPDYEFSFDSGIIFTLSPKYNEKGGLYQIQLSTNDKSKKALQGLTDFYVNNNPTYQTFDKHRIRENLYYAIKDNFLITFDSTTGILYYTNVPEIPQEEFGK